MTRERRIVFGLNDIISVRIGCLHEDCGGEAVIDLNSDKAGTMPSACTVCNRPWIIRGRPIEAGFLSSLDLIRKSENQSFRLLFELNDDSPDRG